MGLGPHGMTERQTMREFDTGATRDSADGKPDYEGYMSPLVVRRYGQYMLSHQVQSDGKSRDSDNWQKGIPAKEYVKSLLRHVMDLWSLWRGYPVYDKAGKAVDIEDVCCAILFNVSGFLHVRLKTNFERIEVTRYDPIRGITRGSDDAGQYDPTAKPSKAPGRVTMERHEKGGNF